MSDKFIGQTLAEKYRIEELWRNGGLGSIYRGKHLLMDKDVTVKILSPALAVDENIVKRFSDEARTVSHISHPNILNVTDFGTDENGAVYIVSEESEGKTLKETIAHEGKFTPERAVRVARQIASALSVAHAAGVVHRNLTSDNVLLAHTVNNAEIVKVLEFGADNLTDENESLDEENVPQNLEYRSPEQCSDAEQVDARSDIYAAGVILYEMLAGEVPFTAEKPTELMLKHAQEPPAPLSAFRSDLPDEIEPVIIRALAKTPEMRYQTADEFADELNKLAKNFDEVETVIIPKAQINADEPPNNIWKTAFLVLAGISVLAIGLIYATQVKQTNPTTQLTDANGQPVQPLNPATGMGEQGNLMQMQYSMQELANMNLNANTAANGMLPGDYNPLWNQGYVPQQGNYVQPSGNYYDANMIDPNSPFTRENDIIISNQSNVNTQQNTAVNTPKATPTPARSPTPAPTRETSPTPAKTPVPNPTDKPSTNKPTSEKQVTSDKKQDTN